MEGVSVPACMHLCMCVLFLENDSTSLCQCPDAVSAWLLWCRLKGPGINQQECFIALQLAVSSQRYDSILSCGMQSHGV